jgi:hypothetical protein
MSRVNALLEWASEAADGSWRDWREACGELDLEPTSAIQNLASLGHVEIDWRTDRFCCPAPTAAFLHRSSGSVLLTGARPRGLVDRLTELGDALLDLDFVVHDARPQARGPDTILIEIDLGDAEAFCAAADLAWTFDPAGRIAAALAVASLRTVAMREPWPPRDDLPRRRFDPVRGRFVADGGRGDHGLWHYDGYRRAEAWFFDGECWWHMPIREYGPYLAHPDVALLRYRREARQLLVFVEAPLPPLHARAVTLASGRLPARTAVAGPPAWAYENVTENLAGRIADSLSAQLERMA